MSTVSYDFSERPAAVPMPAVDSMLGNSAAMQEVFRLIERVGPTEASVLLTGESGPGKELAAQMIHECSARRGKPFIAINCGAIPAGLRLVDSKTSTTGVIMATYEPAGAIITGSFVPEPPTESKG